MNLIHDRYYPINVTIFKQLLKTYLILNKDISLF